MENVRLTNTEWHRKMAVDLFNITWEFIDKKQRSSLENDMMAHCAHASRYHWGIVGKPIHWQRGEWLISRVYALLKRGESALFHARRCLSLCREYDFKDWDLAFAYEAIARAHYTHNDGKECLVALQLAKDAGLHINDTKIKNYFFEELASIPLYEKE